MRNQTLLATGVSITVSVLAGCQSRPAASLATTERGRPATAIVTSANVPRFKVDMEHNGSDEGATGFKFKGIPAPSKGDAASQAKVILVDGQRDGNGGDLGKLTDDRVPKGSDQPSDNFFFAQGTDGGRIQVDLGRVRNIKQINTYSWHANTRGPQVYQLYASTGDAVGFNSEPRRGTDPGSCGWKMITQVDTRPREGQVGGQHGVSISAMNGDIGQFRYLLFDISRTEDRDPFGNTFFSEIDVIDPNAPALAAITSEEAKSITKSFEADGGKYRFTIDSTVAPDLTEWADTKLRPVVQEWYPKLVAMLPSEGFQPTTNVTLRFRDDMGGTPASAGGGRINMNAGWYRRELNREALGATVHEMVHVVQRYGRVSRDNTNAMRMPGWLVEGIPDYIRWFLYEPQTKGAEVTQRNLSRAKYDASYRITGNFLNWVTQKYDTNLVQKLNAAGRAGKYNEALWKEYTGKTVQELGEEWKKSHEERLAALNKDAAVDPKKPSAP